MLQIIGWILCLMLLVKSLELAGDEALGVWSDAGAGVAFMSAFAFAALLYWQGAEGQRIMESL